MKKLSLVLFALLSTQTFAQQFEISGVEFYNEALVPGAPQIFIFDKNGQLIHHSDELDKQIVKAFNKSQPLASEQVIIPKLKKILGLKQLSNDQDFTVYSVMMEQSKPCKPCEIQHEFLQMALRKHADKNITVNTITLSL